MHLLVPYAAPLSEAGREAMKTLRLPALGALLRELDAVERDDADATSLSPPHERALAREYGWPVADGALPWGAHEAARAGVAPGDLAWALLTPVHWHVGSDGVSVLDPETLSLDEAASRALFDAVRPAFDGERGAIVWRSPLQWLAAHPAFEGVATASLDRVVGRGVDPWLPDAADAPVRRLQMELQMRLHGHPANDEREARGLAAVNSVWVSGAGTHRPASPAAVEIDDRLRGPLLAEDWAAWLDAWRALDAGPVAALRGGEAVLTLCGERGALRLQRRPRSVWQRFIGSLQPTDPVAVLETL